MLVSFRPNKNQLKILKASSLPLVTVLNSRSLYNKHENFKKYGKLVSSFADYHLWKVSSQIKTYSSKKIVVVIQKKFYMYDMLLKVSQRKEYLVSFCFTKQKFMNYNTIIKIVSERNVK